MPQSIEIDPELRNALNGILVRRKNYYDVYVKYTSKMCFKRKVVPVYMACRKLDGFTKKYFVLVVYLDIERNHIHAVTQTQDKITP